MRQQHIPFRKILELLETRGFLNGRVLAQRSNGEWFEIHIEPASHLWSEGSLGFCGSGRKDHEL